MLPNTPQGCRQMNVKCPTPAGFPKTVMRVCWLHSIARKKGSLLDLIHRSVFSFLQFNGVGPPKVGKNLVALVSCVNTMYGGSWRTMYGGHWM